MDWALEFTGPGDMVMMPWIFGLEGYGGRYFLHPGKEKGKMVGWLRGLLWDFCLKEVTRRGDCEYHLSLLRRNYFGREREMVYKHL